MKPDQNGWFGAGGALTQPKSGRAENLKPPEIVGEVANPVFEAVRRLWWRAFDRICGCVMLIRLSIQNRIYGPEPPTSSELEREADQERLVRVFSVGRGSPARQN